MTLNDIKVGQKVKIIKTSKLNSTLISFGFVKNSIVKLIEIAPFGDPKLFEIFGSCVALDKKTCKKIKVKKIGKHNNGKK